MAIFEDVTLTWKGEDHVVKSTDLLKLIAKVEREITIEQLCNEAGPPRAGLAMAYAVALNHAGAKVSADEVYLAIFKDGDSMMAAVSGLLVMMMPPETYQPQGKSTAEASQAEE